MFWNPQIETIEQLIERGEITEEEIYGYYEVKTETYSKPKRKRFYKNYISRRKKWESLLVFLNCFS